MKLAAFLSAIVLLGLHALGQTNPPADQQVAVPTVTFTLDWPGADPEHYVIAIEYNGNGSYESSGRKSAPQSNVYTTKFSVTEGTRQRIFETARTLKYFNSDFDYKKKKVAFTGNKVLAYADASRHYQSSYNWSDDATVRQLTDLMQALGATLEFGRSLEYLHRYDRLGLNEELKRVDELAAEKQLAELQVLAPQLEQIAADANVMEIARQKARKILQRANAGITAAHSPSAAQQ